MRADSIQPASPAHTWVVRLSRHGEVAPAPVGPFATEDEACEWAASCCAGSPGWDWSVEVVVSPAVLPATAEAPRPHLRLVR
jgi:hypothetical protein